MRVLNNIIPFIEKKLFLKVNVAKSRTGHVKMTRFLGHSFYLYRGKARLRVHPKAIVKMKARVRELTARSQGASNEERPKRLKRYIMGWINYFKMADMKSLLKGVDQWMRRRIRMMYWKQWKKIKTRGKNLIKLGIPPHKAWEFANTRKGYWRVAGSPILSRAITNQKLKANGYLFFFDYYSQMCVN